MLTVKHSRGSIFMPIIAKEERISYMNELRERKVAQHNDLITSVAKMDKTPLKIFELAVSSIDTENPPKDNVIYLSKKELFAFFDVTDSNKHTRFKEAIEKMQKQAYFQIKENKELGLDFESIIPIPYIKWTDYNDEVMIQFTPQIMPYLIDLKRNFTQYAITDIMDLESKYSIILYKWFSMNFNQFENYKDKGNRTQKQLYDYKNPQISIKDLRIMTDTETDYIKRFDNFETKVLKTATSEINQYTHLDVAYEKVKKGRSIIAIQFHINAKKNWADEKYKNNQNDSVYIDAKKQNEQEKAMLVQNALQSEFTLLLSENFLIFPKDFMNTETMADLQRHVYPLYEQLKKEKGISEVKKHIAYVASKQEAYSKHNISKYLKKAIEQYLSVTKRQDVGNG